MSTIQTINVKHPSSASNNIVLDSSGNMTVAGSLTAGTLVGGGFSNLQVFTSSGTWTVPAGVTKAKVTVIGGGGGGGGCGSASGNNRYGNGGGGGGGSIEVVTGLTPGASVTVTVGAGGTAASNANGGSGGTSSFGAFLSATGGAGGTIVTFNGPGGGVPTQYGAAAGTGSGGDINVPGQVGQSYFQSASNPACPGFTQNFTSGMGGDSAFSFGRGGQWVSYNAASNGNAGTGFGAGGSGANQTNVSRSGGVGTAGIVIVEW